MPAINTHATTTVAAPLKANVTRGCELSHALRRTGSSTRIFVSQAASTVRTTIAMRARGVSASATTNGAKTSSGQCHRYTEYEMPPTNCIGRARSARDGAQRACGTRAWMTASAPSTGTSAAEPGNGVFVL